MKPARPFLHHIVGAATVAVIAFAAATIEGCVPYPVYTTPPASKYDRVWDAAYGAATDVGVQIQSADRGSGLIRGVKEQVTVTITVRSQPDGGAVAEIKATGPTPHDRVVSQQLSQAYERRMGR
ncbi:MAG TPA: hypothetical protein VF104_11660 [Burkholderiales bacterium]